MVINVYWSSVIDRGHLSVLEKDGSARVRFFDAAPLRHDCPAAAGDAGTVGASVFARAGGLLWAGTCLQFGPELLGGVGLLGLEDLGLDGGLGGLAAGVLCEGTRSLRYSSPGAA